MRHVGFPTTPCATDFLKLLACSPRSNFATTFTCCRPRMVWNATLDCLIHLPYPAWFYSWIVLNRGAGQLRDSPAGRAAAARAAEGSAAAASSGTERAAGQAGAPPAAAAAAAGARRGPLAGISAADCDAALAAAAADGQRQWQEDYELLTGMLVAAEEAAAAVGQPLNADAKVGVLMAGADVILRRQQQQYEAEQAEMEAADDESAAADEAALEQQERWWQALAEGGPAAEAARAEIEAAAAAAEAPAEQLPPPRLAGVHSQPYEFEGQQREHRWVFLDYEQQHRQRGRQQFDLYPRHPQAGAAAAEEAAAHVEQDEEEDWEVAQLRLIEDQERQFALLPPAEQLLQQEWGSQAGAEAQQAQQEAQPSATQQQQPAAPAGPGSAGSKKKRRQGSSKQAQQEEQQWAEAGQAPQQVEEELFPFTFDWEKQQRRRRAGRLLRRLFGDKFEALMAQVRLKFGWFRAILCSVYSPCTLACCRGTAHLSHRVPIALQRWFGLTLPSHRASSSTCERACSSTAPLQLPRRGARLGRNSNAALALEEEQEGTQWLGCVQSCRWVPAGYECVLRGQAWTSLRASASPCSCDLSALHAALAAQHVLLGEPALARPPAAPFPCPCHPQLHELSQG